jgi:hypothetical protein
MKRPGRDDDRSTRARRARVRELFGRSNREIAETLLDEGFEIASAERRPRTTKAVAEWDAKRVAAMTRNVINDKEWFREQWKAKRELSTDDPLVAREEHIAALSSDLDQINDFIGETATKPTAKSIAFGERRQTRALLAKARGVEEIAPRDPDADKPRPVIVGLRIGTTSLTAEELRELKERGVEIGD